MALATFPEYSYRESPRSGISPARGVRLPSGYGQDIPVALERGGAAVEREGSLLVHVEERLEASRQQVRTQHFLAQLDTQAAAAVENPDPALSPEESQQAYTQAATEAMDGHLSTVRNPNLRNQIQAHIEARIESHSLQVRHAARLKMVGEIVAGTQAQRDELLAKFQVAAEPEARDAIAGEYFETLDRHVRDGILAAKAAENEKHAFLRAGNIGAAEHDGSIRPEETLRDLFTEDERGFVHYGNLTFQERSTAAHNIIAGRNALQKQLRETRTAAEKDRMSAISSALYRGELGGPDSPTGMPVDHAALEDLIRGMEPEHQAWVRTQAREYETRTTVAETRASKTLAAQIVNGTVNASPDTLARKLEQVDAAAASGLIRPEDAEPARKHIRAEQEHQDRASDRNQNAQDRAEKQAQKAAKARALRYRDSWFPVAKGPAGKMLDQQLLAEGRALSETVIADAIDKGEDPVRALEAHRPEIEAMIYGGLKEARDAQDAILGNYLPKPKVKNKPGLEGLSP